MLIRTDTRQPWQGEALADIRYPRNIEALWPDNDLAAIGLVRAKEAVIPTGERRTGPSEYLDDGTEIIPTEPVPPPTEEEVAAEKERQVDALPVIALDTLFDQENRIRAIEGQWPITREEFRAAIKARL